MGETTAVANPFLNTEPFGPQSGDDTVSAPPAAANPFMQSPLSTSYDKVPSNEHGTGSIASRAIDAVRSNVEQSYATRGQPLFADDAPVELPFMTAVGHGARYALDSAAEKVARVAGAIFPPIPGVTTADDIRADITQREKDYQANPDNATTSAGAVIGRGVGTGLALGGPLARIGGAAASLLDSAGATALPAVARAIEYLSGGAKAAPDATRAAQIATRGGSLAAQGGAQGAGTAAIEADPNKPFLPQVAEGAGAGAIANPVVGAGIFSAAYPLRAAMGMVPNMVQRDVAPLADRFIKQYGIDLDPTQLTLNPTYRLMTDQAGKLPLSGAGNRVAAARLQWQKALAGEMGETADNGITHGVMDSASSRIGSGMNNIADRTVITDGSEGANSVQKSLTDIANQVPEFGLTETQKTPVQAQFQNVLKAFEDGGGKISGKTYQNLTQTGGPLDSVISSTDPTVAGFGMRIKNVLDDAFQRSASPEDRAALQALRYQYRVMKTVQPLVEQKGLTGDVEPNGLLQRVIAQSRKLDSSNQGIAYTGGGKLGDLAYGGQIFFGKPSDSGTAARNWITAGLIGGGAANAMAHPIVPAATLAGLLANRAIQSGLRSTGVGANMVQNSLTPNLGPRRNLPGVIPGLLGY